MLAIDDDAAIRKLYKRVLDSLFESKAADSCASARELLGSGERFDVLILDLNMPGEDTVAFWEWLVEEHPKLAANTLVISGALDDIRWRSIVESREGWAIQKPVSPWALRDRLWELTSGGDEIPEEAKVGEGR